MFVSSLRGLQQNIHFKLCSYYYVVNNHEQNWGYNIKKRPQTYKGKSTGIKAVRLGGEGRRRRRSTSKSVVVVLEKKRYSA